MKTVQKRCFKHKAQLILNNIFIFFKVLWDNQIMQSICWTPVEWRWRLVSVSTMIGITTASLGTTQPATTRSPSSVKTLSLSWGKPETSAQTSFCETHRKWGDKLQDDNYCNTEWEKHWSWKHFWKIRAAETCMPHCHNLQQLGKSFCNEFFTLWVILIQALVYISCQFMQRDLNHRSDV